MPILPGVTPIHGQASRTFSPPPLDGLLTIPELFDWHRDHSPDHPIFVYSTSAEDRTEITFKQGIDAAHRAGALLADRLVKLGLRPSAAEHDGPIIAILAATGTPMLSPHLPSADSGALLKIPSLIFCPGSVSCERDTSCFMSLHATQLLPFPIC